MSKYSFVKDRINDRYIDRHYLLATGMADIQNVHLQSCMRNWLSGMQAFKSPSALPGALLQTPSLLSTKNMIL